MTTKPTAARILLAEDEEIIRALVQTALARSGHEVLLAADGECALELLREEGDALDLVILDLVMPCRSGLEVLVELRREHAHLPVLLTSGMNHSEDLRAAEALGVQGFIAKPFSLKSLSALVQTALQTSRA